MLPRVTYNLHVLAINSIITSSNFSNRPKCKFIPRNPSDTTMSQKMITLICYSNGKIVSGRKGICYEGPSPRASIIRAEATFEEFMDKVHQITGYGRLYSGLRAVPLEKWALAHDGGKRFGLMTTNFSEVFNSVLKGARNLPITACVQMTFYRVNDYFVLRRRAAAAALSDGGQYPPQIAAKLSAYGPRANRHSVRVFNFQQGIVEVKTGESSVSPNKGGHVQLVDLVSRICTCQKPQLYGHYCSHMLAACRHLSMDPHQYVAMWYNLATYLQTWQATFRPIPDPAYWPACQRPTLLPDPTMRRSAKGRPRSTRLHNEMDVREGRGTVRCGKCREPGHNRRHCPRDSATN